jgi:hypothetical protein
LDARARTVAPPTCTNTAERDSGNTRANFNLGFGVDGSGLSLPRCCHLYAVDFAMPRRLATLSADCPDSRISSKNRCWSAAVYRLRIHPLCMVTRPKNRWGRCSGYVVIARRRQWLDESTTQPFVVTAGQVVIDECPDQGSQGCSPKITNSSKHEALGPDGLQQRRLDGSDRGVARPWQPSSWCTWVEPLK